jgi:hypothetical protein
VLTFWKDYETPGDYTTLAEVEEAIEREEKRIEWLYEVEEDKCRRLGEPLWALDMVTPECEKRCRAQTKLKALEEMREEMLNWEEDHEDEENEEEEEGQANDGEEANVDGVREPVIRCWCGGERRGFQGKCSRRL